MVARGLLCYLRDSEGIRFRTDVPRIILKRHKNTKKPYLHSESGQHFGDPWVWLTIYTRNVFYDEIELLDLLSTIAFYCNAIILKRRSPEK